MTTAAASDTASVQDEIRLHAMLRFGVGVTAAFVLCEFLGWLPSFLAPVLTAILLVNVPVRLPLKMALGLVLTMTVAALFAAGLASLLRGTPVVLFGLIAVCVFVAFHAMAEGRARVPALLLLICLSVVPVMVMIAPALAEILPMALIRGTALAVVVVIGVHMLWPRVRPPVPPAAPAPGAATPLSLALLSCAVVLPLMLFYLLLGITDALPVLVGTVMLVANFDPRRSQMQALAMIIANFAGGLLGLLLHVVLTTMPNLLFLALLLFLVLLGLARRIVAGGPVAGVVLIACNTMLIILSIGIASGPPSLSLWLTRVFQFVLAGAFAVGMMNLVWHRATPDRPGPAKPAIR